MGVLVALLAVAALVTALVAGALIDRTHTSGPATNGEILFVDRSGEVVAGDPATGQSRVVIATARNTKPIVSPDGTKLLVLRPSAAGSQNIFVIDLQGNETRITPDALTAYHYVGWSPAGDRILVRDDGGRILLLDATQTAAPFSLSRSIQMGNLWIGAGFNYRSSTAFRPPNGDEILFTGNDGGRWLPSARTARGYGPFSTSRPPGSACPSTPPSGRRMAGRSRSRSRRIGTGPEPPTSSTPTGQPSPAQRDRRPVEPDVVARRDPGRVRVLDPGRKG